LRAITDTVVTVVVTARLLLRIKTQVTKVGELLFKLSLN